jgi:transposase
MIPISLSARIWIATGYTDMRKGMQGLSLLVQGSLGRDPFAGAVFVFRGRSGSLNSHPALYARTRSAKPDKQRPALT